MRLPIRSIVVSVATLLPFAASASTYTYNLDNTFTSSTGGPSLVADGGTLGATGYTFGKDQGLTLGNVGGASFSSYTIAVQFSFDTLGGYQKIVDFSNLASDAGLYSLGSRIDFYPVNNGGTITTNTLEKVVLSRSAAGAVSVSLNGNPLFSFDDSATNYAALSPTSTLRFFEDDTHTGGGEAASGFVDSITITTDAAVSTVPLPASLPMFGAALLAFGTVGYGMKRKKRWAAI